MPKTCLNLIAVVLKDKTTKQAATQVTSWSTNLKDMYLKLHE